MNVIEIIILDYIDQNLSQIEDNSTRIIGKLCRALYVSTSKMQKIRTLKVKLFKHERYNQLANILKRALPNKNTLKYIRFKANIVYYLHITTIKKNLDQ
jgi:hypothetical protein